MAGERLIRLLRYDRWDLIGPLADDPPDAHRTARGGDCGCFKIDASALERAHYPVPDDYSTLIIIGSPTSLT